MTGGESYFDHNAQGVLDLRFDSRPRCGANCSTPLFDEVGTYSTHLFTRRAVEVIESHDTEQRLFLYLAYQAVHCPREVPASYVAPYARANMSEPRATFAGMLSCLDEGVANVTSALKARGMWNDTLLFFSTDNGAPTPSCGGAQGGQNWPLRGGKCSAWEGGLRGTAFVHSPLLPAAARGRRTTALMHATDVLPTLLDAAGAPSAAQRQNARGLPLDGVSQWPVIAGDERANTVTYNSTSAPRTEILLEADDHSLPLQRQYCGDQHGSGPGTPYYAFRRAQWKLLVGDPAGGTGDGWYCTGAPCPFVGWDASAPGESFNLTTSSMQLYDVVADPGERFELSHEHPSVVADLLAALRAYNASAVPSYVCGPDGPWKQNGTLAPFA